MKSNTRHLVFLLFVALTIIAVSCTASSSALPSPGKQILTPTHIPSSMPTRHPATTPQPTPTWVSGTLVPPSGEWATYTYPNSGLSFRYPANWFIWLNEEYNRVEILNAPAESMIAIKCSEGGCADFVRMIVDLKPIDISLAQTFETYVNDTINQPNWAAGIISVESIPALRQGYPAVRVISSGLGEWTHYFIENDRHVMHVTTGYLPDRRAEFAFVVEEVVNTLMFP